MKLIVFTTYLVLSELALRKIVEAARICYHLREGPLLDGPAMASQSILV
jgi:hypothetical protein